MTFSVTHAKNSCLNKINCHVGFELGERWFKFVLSPEIMLKKRKTGDLTKSEKSRQSIFVNHSLGKIYVDRLVNNMIDSLKTDGFDVKDNILNSSCVLICLTNFFLESEYGKFAIKDAIKSNKRVIYLFFEDIESSKLPEAFSQTESINYKGDMMSMMADLKEKLAIYKTESTDTSATCEPSLNPRSKNIYYFHNFLIV
jgi:hypothetical protein